MFAAQVRTPPTISDTAVVDTSDARISSEMCGFLPLRHGVADDPRRTITLTSDRTVTLQVRQEHTMDLSWLVGVLDEPRAEVWTDLRYGPMQSLEWLYLWLTCVFDRGLCSMTVEESVADTGLVDPMFRWAPWPWWGQGTRVPDMATRRGRARWVE